jgi:hypothetical protein
VGTSRSQYQLSRGTAQLRAANKAELARERHERGHKLEVYLQPLGSSTYVFVPKKLEELDNDRSFISEDGALAAAWFSPTAK